MGKVEPSHICFEPSAKEKLKSMIDIKKHIISARLEIMCFSISHGVNQCKQSLFLIVF